MAESDRLQLGQAMASAGAATEDRQLVVDEPEAAIGEDGWPIGRARPVLLAASGGEPPDAAVVREHGAADRGAGGADRVGKGRGGREIGQRGGRGRKGVGVIRQEGRSCLSRGPREEQDDPFGTAGQAFRRRR